MYITANVTGCCRCGQDHPRLKFAPLENPHDQYKWWANCPVKNQPILLRVMNDQSEEELKKMAEVYRMA